MDYTEYQNIGLKRDNNMTELEKTESTQMKIQIDTTEERDIDLLIIEEFISDSDFASIFLNAAGISGAYAVEKAIHSKTDVDLGESDIVFILNINGLRHALHIEDKIDAIAMKNQSGRYIKRAEKDIANGEYDTYSVLIVAPQKYLDNNEEAKKYPHQVKYEQLQEHFKSKKDTRSKYKLALIERAIIEQKNGYQWKENPWVVRFCTAMNDYKRKNYPGLPDGTVAWWPEYSTLLSDVKVVFKANKGFCDLQFGHTDAKDLYFRVKDYLSERMNVVTAGKSSSVRIIVTPISFENNFEDNISEVDEALVAICELYELSKKLLK